MEVFDLVPVDGRKSFYGKARVFRFNDGTAFLKSYDTNVARRDPDGSLHRLVGSMNGWRGAEAVTATTMRHIRAFCGITRDEWLKMPVEHDDSLIRLLMAAKTM